jgi:hypothetical protein
MKVFLMYFLLSGQVIAFDALGTKTVPVKIYNDTSDFCMKISHNNTPYDIPVIKEKYQLSGAEIPLIFIKQNDTLIGTFSAIAYVLKDTHKEYVESSDIVFDLRIEVPKDATKLKSILNELFFIKLHYSSENDWQMKYVGSTNAHFAFKHLKINNENKQ